MIEYAKSKQMYVSISTNGTLFSGNNISKLFASPPDKLIYSFDGTDEESYNKYRVGGDFNEVKKGLKAIVSEKKKRGLSLPYIELQMIVMKHNEGSINDFIEFGKGAGADKVTLKTMQIYNQEEADTLLPENPGYSRYTKINGKYKLKHKLNNRCFALWRSAVVTWDGHLAACCFDKDAEFSTSNLTERDFDSLFKSDVLQGLRGQILKNRKAVDICRNCSEGMKVNVREISF